ncbi:salicylate synthase [Streptomyces sp.]|uniref:salicylate synthase n=1 Tax=Streptomyces sp. TaxID=1931 RepID=UPI002BF09538|nr:salicylate synthase [Streptomyces sp.]HLL33505.1 salicylate synthase [Streptomyces sp.]HZF86889.1 salicylate synthase [Streptomyces sp.]
MPTQHIYRHEREVPMVSDPLAVAARLAEACATEPHLLYESGNVWSLGCGVLAEIRLSRGGITYRCADDLRELPWQDDPLRTVEQLLADLPVENWRAYGWGGFDLAYVNAGLTELVRDEQLLHLVVPRTEVRLDSRRALLRSVDREQLETLAEVLAKPAELPVHRTSPVDVETALAQEYRAAVDRAVEEIRGTALQKVILSRRVPVDHPVDLLGTYIEGRKANTPARSFLIGFPDMRAAGFSPEIVAEVSADGRVVSQPLAGTRALTGDAERDRATREILLNDVKEVFEHAISVKVSCSEMNEVCTPGSVVVDDFMTVKERGTVQHLASSVSGRLADGLSAWDAFKALFPAVTASGVPKREAYRSISRNEPHPRGLYSGTVMTVDSSGAMDSALVLRTLFTDHTGSGRSWLQAGAGIVEHSTAEREYRETCEKLLSVALHIVPAQRQ